QFIVSNYDIGIAMMALTAVAWALTIEQGDLPLVAIAVVMTIAAFISTRNLPIAMIAMSAPLARHLPRAWHSMVPASESARPPHPSGWINQAILIALSIVFFVQNGFFSR